MKSIETLLNEKIDRIAGHLYKHIGKGKIKEIEIISEEDIQIVLWDYLDMTEEEILYDYLEVTENCRSFRTLLSDYDALAFELEDETNYANFTISIEVF